MIHQRRGRGSGVVGLAGVRRGLLCLVAAGSIATTHAEVLSVQPAHLDDGDLVHGVLRSVPRQRIDPGQVLSVQVTAADTRIGPANAGGNAEACPTCTATLHFLIRESRDERPRALRRPPVSYLHVGGREYMLWTVRLSWEDDRTPTLTRATLVETGFVPPPFKRRIRLRFGPPLDAGADLALIAAKAQRDMAAVYGAEAAPGDS